MPSALKHGVAHWQREAKQQKDELTSITVMLGDQLRELSGVQQTHNSALHAGLAELTGQWKAELEGLQGETIEGQRRLVAEFQTALATLHRQAAEAEGGRLATVEKLSSESEELLRVRVDSEARWTEEHRAQLEKITQAVSGQLSELRDEESRRAEQAVSGLARLEETFATQVARLGQELEAPLREMIQVSSEAPKAASVK